MHPAVHVAVLSGILQALVIPSINVTLVVHPECMHTGFPSLTNHFNFSLRPLAHHDQPMPVGWTAEERYDVVLLVSPEYRTHFAREFVQASQPSTVIAWVHNGDTGAVPGAVVVGHVFVSVHPYPLWHELTGARQA